MTAIILQTTKILLRWSEKPFNGKSPARNQIILRHRGTSRTGKLASGFTENADGAANLNRGNVALARKRRVDAPENAAIYNHPALAFGVRLIY